MNDIVTYGLGLRGFEKKAEEGGFLDSMGTMSDVMSGIRNTPVPVRNQAANNLIGQLANAAEGDSVASKTQNLINAVANHNVSAMKTDPLTLALLGAGLGGVVGGATNPAGMISGALRGALAGGGALAGWRLGQGLGRNMAPGNANAELIGGIGGGLAGLLGGKMIGGIIA